MPNSSLYSAPLSATAILITVCMALAAIGFPLRIAQSARALGFPKTKQVRVTRIAALVMGLWFAFVLWGSLTGFFATPPFSVLGVPVTHVNYLALGPVLLGVTLIAVSPTTRALLDTLAPQRVMLIETARAIGGVFLVRYFQGELPGIFALPAGIGDLLVGLTAPLMAYLYVKKGDQVRNLAIAWNIFGILELIVSLTMGYLVSTLKLFSVSIPTTTAFPLILIPGFGVPLMILFHLIALRLLVRQRASNTIP
jgi:hypothetical protein